ncbi:hypothetical protein NRK67_16960 (plasmid) [Fusobacteria bacterium ZRK30]|nr:hypothetical protein NRK67_16960 [Fusobacteria bacterium ZRK30]
MKSMPIFPMEPIPMILSMKSGMKKRILLTSTTKLRKLLLLAITTKLKKVAQIKIILGTT